MTEQNKFECWAIVEVMGHRQFAGFVSEQAIGGASFVRVDVPEIVCEDETLPAFTKLLGAGSIYAISPCTEETARAFAARLRMRSFSVYEAPRLPSPVGTYGQIECEPDPDWPLCGVCGCELARSNDTGLCVDCQADAQDQDMDEIPL